MEIFVNLTHVSTNIITVSSNSKHALKGFCVLILPFYEEVFSSSSLVALSGLSVP